MHRHADIFWNIKPVSFNTNGSLPHGDSVIAASSISQSLKPKSQSAHTPYETQKDEGRKGRHEDEHVCLTCMPSSCLCAPSTPSTLLFLHTKHTNTCALMVCFHCHVSMHAHHCGSSDTPDLTWKQANPPLKNTHTLTHLAQQQVEICNLHLLYHTFMKRREHKHTCTPVPPITQSSSMQHHSYQPDIVTSQRNAECLSQECKDGGIKLPFLLNDGASSSSTRLPLPPPPSPFFPPLQLCAFPAPRGSVGVPPRWFL